jgi:hypothetical protein
MDSVQAATFRPLDHGIAREAEAFELLERHDPELLSCNPTHFLIKAPLMGRKPPYISGFRPINIVLSRRLGHGVMVAGKCARVGTPWCQLAHASRTKKGPA